MDRVGTCAAFVTPCPALQRISAPRAPQLCVRRGRGAALGGHGRSQLRCTAAPRPDPPLRGLQGTGPLYAVLAAAQTIPFVFPVSGVVGDVTYFSTTAVTAIILGCRRAAMEGDSFRTQLVSPKIAALAPFAASGVLLTFYLLLKYTSLDVSLILNGMTSLSAAVFLKESLDSLCVSLFGALGLNNERPEKGSSAVMLAPSEWVASATAFAITLGYLTTKSFVLSNALALGIVARVLSLVRLESFTVAVALLGGLLLYDVWWVFGSTLVFDDNVMVSTAYLDSPGKLLFPRQAIDGVARGADEFQYAVLGLGDLFVPGLFVTLTSALDTEVDGASSYFNTAIACYAGALLITFAANSLTSYPQPALLYIVPALLLGTFGNAARRGELQRLISFKLQKDESGEQST